MKPQLHVFGHIHAAYGQERILFDDEQRAFEDIVIARGGMKRLLSLLYKFIAAFFSGTSSKSTLLVRRKRCSCRESSG